MSELQTITMSIDVTQLDKSRFKEVTRKNGAKAVFAEIVLLPSPNSNYGDYMVKQSATKEEREAKVQLPILGNAKIAGGRAPKPAVKPVAPAMVRNPPRQDGDDDVPF